MKLSPAFTKEGREKSEAEAAHRAEARQLLNELKRNDPLLEECTCPATHLFSYGHKKDCPYIEAREPKAKGCVCEEDYSLNWAYADDYSCRCGVDKHHYHCPACRGITQVG